VKRILIILTICLSFGLTAAFASDSADYYAKRCAKCHGADGSKSSGMTGGTVLKGQSADAIKTKLIGYQDGSYGGAKKKMMERMVTKLSEEEIAGLATVIGGF
jgi:cytochrome c